MADANPTLDGVNMDDKEITKLCAEAMGWKHLGAVGVLPLEGEEKRDYANRADAAGKLWCYSLQNDWWTDPDGRSVCGPCQGIPDPLHNDEDAMALVKKLRVQIHADPRTWWASLWVDQEMYDSADHEDINMAICECVANMQRAQCIRP